MSHRFCTKLPMLFSAAFLICDISVKRFQSLLFAEENANIEVVLTVHLLYVLLMFFG